MSRLLKKIMIARGILQFDLSVYSMRMNFSWRCRALQTEQNLYKPAK